MQSRSYIFTSDLESRYFSKSNCLLAHPFCISVEYNWQSGKFGSQGNNEINLPYSDYKQTIRGLIVWYIIKSLLLLYPCRC